MTTSAQLTANRINATHSTGPRTAAGKLASSRNSLRHGLTAKGVVIPGEDPAEYDTLRQELHEDYAPANTAEATIVDQIAQHTWRLQRVRRAETAMFERLMKDNDTDRAIANALNDPCCQLETIRRYEVTIERSYHRAIDQLRKLQKERRTLEKDARKPRMVFPMPAAPILATREEIGFVSQPVAAAAAIGSVSQPETEPRL
jgi:hypothetical protein